MTRPRSGGREVVEDTSGGRGAAGISGPGPAVRVLFQNDDVLAVDKPEGVVSIGQVDDGLPVLLNDIFPGRLFPVHRLDKEVSGVILFAKNAETHRWLNSEFERKAVKKTYLALTHGIITKNRGLINAPIREFGSGRMGVDAKRGKPSVTEFKVEKRLSAYTLVRIFPLTGRRHQIRVHLYHIEHPIVGDLRYGDRARQKTFPRLMLHALSIEFGLASGERLTIEAPVPESFAAVVESLGKGTRSKA